MRTKRMIAALTLLLGSAAIQAAQATDLETTEAKRVAVEQEQVVDAVLEAVNQTTVSAQTSGRIIEINFDVDDFVPKGSVLVRFRDKEQRAAFDSAKAQASEAESNFKRIKDLYQKKTVSKAEYDRAEAAVKSARAQVERAKEQLEYTVVRAPYSGIVVKRHVEPGESANPGQPLMTGISLEKLRAVANVSQAHIDTIRKLSKARVELPDNGAERLVGVDITISPYADPQSHTFKVRVDLPEGQHGVYPGMFVKVAFVTGSVERLLVDKAAIVHRSEVTGVYVIADDGSIMLRHIRAGRQHDGKVEVLAGLEAGEKVALDPIRAAVMLKQQRAGEGS